MIEDGRGPLTRPAESVWRERPAGYRAWERSIEVGSGDAFWRWAAADVLRWGVKTRSGFAVDPEWPVTPGDRPVITVRALGLSVREPVEVIEVVDTARRAGFAYRTLPGHPVSGEEAFIVARVGDAVSLTIRSLTRPSETWPWRAAYPVLLAAQARARRRYLRALRDGPAP